MRPPELTFVKPMLSKQLHPEEYACKSKVVSQRAKGDDNDRTTLLNRLLVIWVSEVDSAFELTRRDQC